MNKRPSRVYSTQLRPKKLELQFELKNRFKILQELDDIDTISESITYMIQQSVVTVASLINEPLESKNCN